MIPSQPGDALWIREGVFVASEINKTGLPIGIYLKNPKYGIFLERQIINDIPYIKTYINNIGERFVEEKDIFEMK
jgi:hypothetical protein